MDESPWSFFEYYSWGAIQERRRIAEEEKLLAERKAATETAKAEARKSLKSFFEFYNWGAFQERRKLVADEKLLAERKAAAERAKPEVIKKLTSFFKEDSEKKAKGAKEKAVRDAGRANRNKPQINKREN